MSYSDYPILGTKIAWARIAKRISTLFWQVNPNFLIKKFKDSLSNLFSMFRKLDNYLVFMN